MRKLGLQFFVACTQPFAFARALGAEVVADLVAAHPTANASGGLGLLQHLRRNWGRLRRGLPCGLLAALAVGPGLDVGNFPTSILLRSDRCDRLVIDLDRLRDLPVRLRRVGLDELRDQFVLLLAGQMAAVNVRADDEGIGVCRAVECNYLVDGEKILACHNARWADNCRTDLDLNGVKPTAAVK